MNFSKLLPAALLLTASLVFFQSANASDICENSIKAICDDTAGQRLENTINLDRIKKDIIAEADPIAKKKIQDFLAKTPKYRFIKRLLQPLRIQNQEIMKVSKKHFTNLDAFINNSDNQNRIKSLMARAINNSKIDNTIKYSMKSIVDQVRMITFSEYIDLLELDKSIIKNAFMNACGSSGLEVNAFAINVNDKDYIVVCPGFLISNSYEKTEEEMFENSLFVLGHELGHHIDSRIFGAAAYYNYLDCMSSHHVEKLNASKKDQNFCDKKKTTRNECQNRIVLSHANEMIGDVWGMKIINEYAKGDALGIFESSQLLINGISPLCGAKDVGMHPSGDFRTGASIGINPEMNRLFECETPPKQVTCNF